MLSSTNWSQIQRGNLFSTTIQRLSNEEHYFASISPLSDQRLSEALAQGHTRALSAFLSLTRFVGKAEMTAWGRVYQDVIETKDHRGQKMAGLGLCSHKDAERILD